MRIGILIALCIAVVAAILLLFPPRNNNIAATPPVSREPVRETSGAPPIPPKADPPTRPARAPEQRATAAPEMPGETIEDQIAAIFDAASSDDPALIESVYDVLTHAPEAELREAALQALVEYAGRDAIPRLAQLAESAPTPADKAKILEAIEFLKLPTLTEIRAAQTATQRPPFKVLERETGGKKPRRESVPP